MMLFFVAFDDSYFNHIVLIKQLRCGNSVTDIRKINPFLYGDESLLVKAVRSGNVDLANLILDKALTLNPLAKGSTCMNIGNLKIASNIAFSSQETTVQNSDMDSVRHRLEDILDTHTAIIVLLCHLTLMLMVVGTLCAKVF